MEISRGKVRPDISRAGRNIGGTTASGIKTLAPPHKNTRVSQNVK